MQRTILITTVQDENGATSEIYGRFDAVTLNRKRLSIIHQEQKMYTMSDEDFVKYGKLKENKNEFWK